MPLTQQELTERLTLPQFPLSAKYDAEWMADNHMGPNALWLMEALCQAMDLRPGMRVLDMGCGRALTSIFLAKEFGVQVWANDLWISASENWQRIRAAGAERLVFPIHAEARALPYADEFFDALLSVDSYHYYGTDDLYLLNYYARLARPGAQIGIVVPGLQSEFEAGLPAHLKPYWAKDFCTFHSPAWWRRLWESADIVDVELADSLPGGWQHWLAWEEALRDSGRYHSQDEVEMLSLDAGRNVGFTRVVARKRV